MKVLIVGGTGALGGHAAAHLQAQGHDVSVAGRKPPVAGTPMAEMPFLQGDYVAGDFTPDRLSGFDWVVFAAGNDPRHVPSGSDWDAFLFKANHEAVPAFFAACREAGVSRAIQLGSFYPQAEPRLLESNSYIRSRLAACEGARAYLVGDENLSFAEYFQLFFDAVGRDVRIEAQDRELPLLPDVAIPQGRGNWIRYEPDAAETALLGYRRNDIKPAVAEIVAQFRTTG